MKICIYGAGAIGGYLGVQLALKGVDVSLVARGPHLRAMQADGLTLRTAGETRNVRLRCAEDPAELGPQDYVILALKAHSVPRIVDRLPALFHDKTAVVTAQNGIPWWYFHKLAGPFENRRIETVDPGGRLWEVIGPDRVIGCVVYASTEVTAPGVIKHLSGDRFTLGEPDNSRSERALALSKALIGAGFKAPVRTNIRDEIWVKLWGNASFNPVSALTLATLDRMVGDPDVRAIIAGIMGEVQKVGEAFGAKFGIDIETRIQRAGEVGAHKTSMLQDLEAGRPMEIDALVSAVAELGRLAGVATPLLRTIEGLVKLRARIAGCYGD